MVGRMPGGRLPGGSPWRLFAGRHLGRKPRRLRGHRKTVRRRIIHHRGARVRCLAVVVGGILVVGGVALGAVGDGGALAGGEVRGALRGAVDER